MTTLEAAGSIVRRPLRRRLPAPGRPMVVNVLGALAGLGFGITVALGVDGPGWTLGLDGYQAMTILADEQVVWTPGFPVDEDGVA